MLEGTREQVAPRAVAALLRSYLLMDLRSQQFARATATKPTEPISPLFWVLGQYLLASGIAATVLYARVDAYFFALVSLGIAALVTASSIIVEFNEIVMDPNDLFVVGHRPISPLTYAAGRAANLLVYVSLMTVSLTLFPAITGAGLRDAGWLWLPAYAAASAIACFCVAGFVILLYTVSLGRPSESIREVLAWTQIVLILVVFYGGQLVFRDSQNRLEMAAYNLPDWVHWLPIAGLASFVDSTAAGFTATRWWILGAGLALTLGVWLVVVRRVAAMYASMGTATPHREEAESKAPWIDRFTARLTRSRDELTAFRLTSLMLSRDADLRMRSWPTLALAAGPLLLGWATGMLEDPLTARGPGAILSLACLYLLTFPLPTVLHNMSFSRDHQASWVLTVAPIENRAGFAEGIRKAVSCGILLPCLLVMTAVFGFVWGSPAHAALHALIGWIAITGAGHAAQIGVMRSLPFSQPVARGSILGEIAPFSAAINAAATLAATVHYFAAARIEWLFAYGALLTLVVAYLRRRALDVIERRHGRPGLA